MKRYIIWIALSVAMATGYAQTAAGPTPDQAYDKVAKVLEKDLQNHKNDLKNQFESKRVEFRKEVDEDLNEIRDKSSTIRLLFFILGGATVIGWVGAWWSLKNRLQATVGEIVTVQYPKQVELEIKKLVKSGSKSLTQLIQEKSFENEVRREMPFCVVCLNKEERNKAEILLDDVLEFKKARYELLEDFTGKADEELIVYYDMSDQMVNNHQETIRSHLAEALEKKHDSIFVVAYPGYWPDLNKYKTIANAANSPYTLYGRMMESLSYLYLKERKQVGLHS